MFLVCCTRTTRAELVAGYALHQRPCARPRYRTRPWRCRGGLWCPQRLPWNKQVRCGLRLHPWEVPGLLGGAVGAGISKLLQRLPVPAGYGIGRRQRQIANRPLCVLPPGRILARRPSALSTLRRRPFRGQHGPDEVQGLRSRHGFRGWCSGLCRLHSWYVLAGRRCVLHRLPCR